MTGANTIVFVLNAFRSGVEDFKFSYSTDGSKWNDMVVVKATADGTEYRYSMPSGTGGTVLVRIRDLDRSKGDRVTDTVTVDRLVFARD